MCKAIEEMRNETARKTSLETAKSLLLIGKLTCGGDCSGYETYR